MKEELQEDLIVDWSFLPVPAWRLYGLRAKLLKQAEQDETHGLLRFLRREAVEANAPTGRVTPAVRVERSAQRKGLQEKVGQGEPLFHFQLLVSARSRNRRRARSIVNAVLAALEQWGQEWDTRRLMRERGQCWQARLRTQNCGAPGRTRTSDTRFRKASMGVLRHLPEFVSRTKSAVEDRGLSQMHDPSVVRTAVNVLRVQHW